MSLTCKLHQLSLPITKSLDRLFLFLFLAITLIRVFVVLIVFSVQHNQRLITQINTDPLHHYHLGLIAYALALLAKSSHTKTILAITGTGVILEEWPVVFRDLGINSPIKYLSTIDLLIIYLAIFTTYLLVLSAQKLTSHHHQPQ